MKIAMTLLMILGSMIASATSLDRRIGIRYQETLIVGENEWEEAERFLSSLHGFNGEFVSTEIACVNASKKISKSEIVTTLNDILQNAGIEGMSYHVVAKGNSFLVKMRDEQNEWEVGKFYLSRCLN